jgi:hypothetical protein
MHRKSLTDRIGGWRNPEELVAPVDCDLMTRAFDSGVRMVSTGRLTVFKFHACVRRDTYLRRDTSEQAAMLARLRADPERCAEQEWFGLMQAWREYRLGTVSLPAVWPGVPGERHRANLIARGVEAPESEDLSSLRRFALDDQLSTMDWHAVEHRPEWGTFRWSGPSPAAMLLLPVRVKRDFQLRLQLLNPFQADLEKELGLVVAGKKVKFRLQAGDAGTVLLSAECGPCQSGPLRIEITCARMRCPHFESGETNPDTRWLGACVNWVEIEPLSSPSYLARALRRTLLPG